jgi:hypothetical protein
MRTKSKQSADQIKVKKWLAIRKKAGRKIDPDTAEVMWTYVCDFDPYGVDPELPEEYNQVGRDYFARSPGSDIWVWFGDLPSATSDALWKKHKASFGFPAGLPHDIEMHTDTDDVSWDNGTVSIKISPEMKETAMRLASEKREQLKAIGFPNPGPG